MILCYAHYAASVVPRSGTADYSIPALERRMNLIVLSEWVMYLQHAANSAAQFLAVCSHDLEGSCPTRHDRGR
jgi:hypothetical protein